MSVAQQSAFTVGLCKARKCCIWRRAGSQGWHSINLFGGRHAIFTQRSTKVGPVYSIYAVQIASRGNITGFRVGFRMDSKGRCILPTM